jgi:L,D-transpeptidase YcbB
MVALGEIRSGFFGAIAIATIACGGNDGKDGVAGGDIDPSWAPQKLTEVRGVPAAQIKSSLTTLLARKRSEPLDEDQWGHARRLYGLYGNTPLWLAPDGLHEKRSQALTNAILNAHLDALRLNAYPIGDLARALAVLQDTDKPTAQQLAAVDLLLTTTYVALGEDLLTGQVDPKSVSQSWFIDPQEERVDSALARAIRESPLESAIARMRPQEEDYVALQRELLRLREIASKGEWPQVPSGRALKPGQTDASSRIQALQARLLLEDLSPGDAAPVADTTARRAAAEGVYSPQLAGAVARFQGRHGIQADSVLGAETVKSLNIPASYRLAQVAANMERYRWLPRSLGDRYLIVNVPAFRVAGYERDRKMIEMKVIVGQEFEGRSTPVFSDSMETVVFRPYWNVTPDIQKKELEPQIAADPGLMARGNYEYYQDGGETRIRQRPGPKNSLGLVKFLFPNDFNIYLHDTPNGELFKEDVRAFSHGCIRLERPAEMAQWVLGWDAARVDAAMHAATDNRSVKIPRKLPVYITYFTAYMRDGQLHYGNDLYFRDDKLLDAVAEGAMPRTHTVQAVEALKRIAKRD